MDDAAGWQAVAAGRFRLARPAAAELAALCQQAASSSAVDRPVDAAAAEQALVRGVDDGIDRQGGDVGLDHAQAGRLRGLPTGGIASQQQLAHAGQQASGQGAGRLKLPHN